MKHVVHRLVIAFGLTACAPLGCFFLSDLSVGKGMGGKGGAGGGTTTVSTASGGSGGATSSSATGGGSGGMATGSGGAATSSSTATTATTSTGGGGGADAGGGCLDDVSSKTYHACVDPDGTFYVQTGLKVMCPGDGGVLQDDQVMAGDWAMTLYAPGKLDANGAPFQLAYMQPGVAYFKLPGATLPDLGLCPYGPPEHRHPLRIGAPSRDGNSYVCMGTSVENQPGLMGSLPMYDDGGPFIDTFAASRGDAGWYPSGEAAAEDMDAGGIEAGCTP